MGNHSDPTANAAVGAVNREWKRMVRRAVLLRRTSREPTPEELRQFTGIYGKLLRVPLDVLERLNEKGA